MSKEWLRQHQASLFVSSVLVTGSLLFNACSGAPPEKYSESPDSPNLKPTPDLMTPSAKTTKTPPPTTSTPQPTETPTPTATAIPIAAKDFKKGDSVEVFTGDNSCLNVRERPTKSAQVLKDPQNKNICLRDFTTDTIETGPVLDDDFYWWYLKKSGGWSAEDYLRKSSGQTAPVPAASGPIFAAGSLTPLQAAEGFLQAAIRRDLTAARGFFAPDKQPTSWDAIFQLDGWIDIWRKPERAYLRFDLSPCASVPYNSVERAVGAFRVINLMFAQNCVHSWGYPSSYERSSDYYVPQKYGVLSLPLEQANGRWYIATFLSWDRQGYMISRTVQ